MIVSGMTMDFDEQLEADFLAEARETAANLELILTSSGDDPSARLLRLKREARILRLRGGAAQPAISKLARMIDDELSALETLEPRHEAMLLALVTKLDHVLDGRPEPSIDDLRPKLALTHDAATIVAAFKEEEIKATNRRVLLVEPNQTTARYIIRELQNCGYRAALARNGIDALKCVFEDRPHMVVTSVVLGDMTGIDLLIALAAMPSTLALPLAVITSYQLGDKALAGLPPRVAIVNKGSNFSRDIADALIRLDVAG